MTEILFVVSEAAEGGYVARAVDASIVTEADDLDQLRAAVREAVHCHFEDGARPKVIRLHLVRDEVIAAQRRIMVRQGEHHITIPAHAQLRVGTLAAILGEVARHAGLERSELAESLFG